MTNNPFTALLKKEKRAKKRNNQAKSNTQFSLAAVPVTKNTSIRVKNPTFKKGPGGSFIVSHTEMATTLFTSVNFSVGEAIVCNPGLTSFGGWIAGIAPNFEKYRFRKLRIHYFSRVPTTTPGAVTMAADYNAGDLAPGSEAVLASYHKAVQFPIWEPNRVYDFDVKRVPDFRYVRATAVPTGQDVKTYDAGVVFLATADCASNGAVAGKVWVEYELELQIPTLPPAGQTAADFSGALTNTTGLSNTSFVGLPSSAQIFGQILNGPAGLLTDSSIPVEATGSYLFEQVLQGTGFNGTVPILSASNGGTVKVLSAIIQNGAIGMVNTWAVNLAGPLSYLIFDNTTVASTISGVEYRLAPYAYQ